MDEYKSNSFKSKEEKKVEKPVVTNAKIKKKSEIKKFTDIFVAEDMGSVKKYVVHDVLIPAIKKLVSDIVTNGTDMLLFGSSSRKSSSAASRVSYRSYYDRPYEKREGRLYDRQSGFDYNDILIQTRGEADEVLSKMEEIIDRYHMVSVADYYELCDITAPYTSNKYGWTSIKNAQIVRVRDGYMIKLPSALPLD